MQLNDIHGGHGQAGTIHWSTQENISSNCRNRYSHWADNYTAGYKQHVTSVVTVYLLKIFIFVSNFQSNLLCHIKIPALE